MATPLVRVREKSNQLRCHHFALWLRRPQLADRPDGNRRVLGIRSRLRSARLGKVRGSAINQLAGAMHVR